MPRAAGSLSPLEPERRRAIARDPLPLLPGGPGDESAAPRLLVVVLHALLFVLRAEPHPTLLGFLRARGVEPEGGDAAATLELALSRRDVYVSVELVGSAPGRPAVS